MRDNVAHGVLSERSLAPIGLRRRIIIERRAHSSFSSVTRSSVLTVARRNLAEIRVSRAGSRQPIRIPAGHIGQY